MLTREALVLRAQRVGCRPQGHSPLRPEAAGALASSPGGRTNVARAFQALDAGPLPSSPLSPGGRVGARLIARRPRGHSRLRREAAGALASSPGGRRRTRLFARRRTSVLRAQRVGCRPQAHSPRRPEGVRTLPGPSRPWTRGHSPLLPSRPEGARAVGTATPIAAPTEHLPRKRGRGEVRKTTSAQACSPATAVAGKHGTHCVRDAKHVARHGREVSQPVARAHYQPGTMVTHAFAPHACRTP